MELPENAIAECVFEVVGYFDADGEMRYQSRMHGSVPISTIFGLVEMAKFDQLASRD